MNPHDTSTHAERDDLARDNERLRAALAGLLKLTEKMFGFLQRVIDAGVATFTPCHTSFELFTVVKLAREALAAPTPEAVAEWRRERALRDAAVELADAYSERESSYASHDRIQAADKAYRALRERLTKEAVSDRMGKS